MAVEYHNRFVAILMGFVIILIKSPLHVCISFRLKILIDTILSPEEFQFDKKKRTHIKIVISDINAIWFRTFCYMPTRLRLSLIA